MLTFSDALSLPEQDKLQVLAKPFGAETEYLRYGIQSAKKKVAETRMGWPIGIKSQDRETVDAYLALPALHRRVVRELIAALAINSKVDMR